MPPVSRATGFRTRRPSGGHSLRCSTSFRGHRAAPDLLEDRATIPHVSQRKATAEDLLAQFGDDARVEIIGGKLLPKAAPRLEHSELQGGLAQAIHRRFHRQSPSKWPGGWWILPELHVQYETYEVYCHDLCGFRRDLHAAIPKAWPVKLRPDWVAELISPSHEKRDLVDKWRVLHRAGVPHYWIGYPEQRVLQVHRWDPSGYVCVLNAEAGEMIHAEPFDAVPLKVEVLFGIEDDED